MNEIPKLLLIITFVSLIASCVNNDKKDKSKIKKMINISSIYPIKDGYRFDFDYYINKHMPMSIELLSKSKGFVKVSVERGIDIENPKINSSYVAMCHYYFKTLDDFMEVFGPNAEKLQGDIQNYTNIEPIIQINEVEITELNDN